MLPFNLKSVHLSQGTAMQRLSLVLDYGIRVNARQILLRATATDLSQPKEGRSKCEVGVLPLAQPQAGVVAVAGPDVYALRLDRRRGMGTLVSSFPIFAPLGFPGDNRLLLVTTPYTISHFKCLAIPFLTSITSITSRIV